MDMTKYEEGLIAKMKENESNTLTSIAEEALKNQEITEKQLSSIKEYILEIEKDHKYYSSDEDRQNTIHLIILLCRIINILKYRRSKGVGVVEKEIENQNIYQLAREIYNQSSYEPDSICNRYSSRAFLNIMRLTLRFLNDKSLIDSIKSDAANTYNKLLYSKYDNVSLVYLEILFKISIFEINSGQNEELAKTLNQSKKVIEVEKAQSITLIEKFIEESILKRHSRLKEDMKEQEENIIKSVTKWLKVIMETGLLDETKYKVLLESLKKTSSDDLLTSKILTIYENIQNIKFQLVVNNFKGLEFGHYTDGEVLQILLQQKESISDNESFIIEGRTRLYNVGYMNDPEEGKLLDKLFEFNKNSGLEDKVGSSPWFLMSLTTAIDELTMWSQYGNNAEGVCLVLKPDSFLEVKSPRDLEWFMSKPIDIDSTQKDEVKDYSSLDSKDCLYKICYLSEDSLKKGEIKIEEEDNTLFKDKTSLSKVECLLKEIKNVIKEVLEKMEELRDDLNKLLEEIRYLFKSSAYSYEKELRILKYSELSPKNNKIKVHNVKPAAKLYLERDTPVELKSIIFGPKYNKPEDVVPLVNLLDEQIECKRSSKKFK